jgi:hypothetical protein
MLGDSANLGGVVLSSRAEDSRWARGGLDADAPSREVREQRRPTPEDASACPHLSMLRTAQLMMPPWAI